MNYFNKFNFKKLLTTGSFCVLLASLSVFARELNESKLRLSIRNLGGSEQTLSEWINLLNTSKNLPTNEKLRRVNDYFNQRLIFTDDQENWGVSDYWATVLESLTKGKADCEDYVIAKYFSLRNLNIDDNQLRLIYVRARLGGMNSNIQQAHMVLAFYPTPDGEPVILDNLISDIRFASKRPDLAPIFSFNSQGVYTGIAAQANLTAGGSGRLSKWQDLLNRSQKEGLDQ